jgi:hypothetical protein
MGVVGREGSSVSGSFSKEEEFSGEGVSVVMWREGCRRGHGGSWVWRRTRGGM